MRKIKSFLKQFYWIRFFHLYLRQLYLKTFYSSTKAKEKYIKRKFKEKLGYEIDFNKEPETFNQKIQFRKLYDNNPLYSICADKYRVREYVKEKIGEEYLIPLYLVTDKLTEEQWDKLPNSFVAKANHDSGTVKIVKCKNKVDKKKVIKELNMSLKSDYGIISMEKYYGDIPRKIIIEEYLGDNIQDYKFHHFSINEDDKMFLQIDGDRFIGHKRSIYDENLEKLPLKFVSKYPKLEMNMKELINKEKLEKMKEIVKKLGEDFNYSRIDLYLINEKIYFGEITFCAESGFGDFEPVEWDYKFGSYWKQKL